MVWVIDNVVETIDVFLKVATNDPVSPLLLLSSAAILVVAIGVFGVLALGGVADWLAGE